MDNSAPVEALTSALNQQMAEWQAAGQLPEAMATLSREILRHTQGRDWLAAADAYARGAAWAAQSGDRAAEAMCLYGQAHTLMNHPQRMPDILPLLRRVVALAEQIGYRTLAVRAHFLLASVVTHTEGDVDGSLAELTRAIEILEAGRHEMLAPAFELAVQVYRTRGTTRWLLGLMADAQRDLEQALAYARQLRADDLILALETDLGVLAGYTDPALDNTAFLDALYEQARLSGQREVLGDIKLHQAITALRRADLATAHQHAEAARLNALEASDPMRYLRYWTACLLQFAIYEERAERREALAILLTCKGTLEKYLGQEAGQLITTFLDTLPERWGAADFQAALQAYREFVAQKPAQPAEAVG